MIITCCGHSSYSFSEEQIKLISNTFELLLKTGENCSFYLGRYGDFDLTCHACLTSLKNKYSNLTLVFVTPYIDCNYTKLKTAKDYYDQVIYPPLETVPKKLCIIRRNEWMVDQADLVISFVKYRGGAEKTLNYAIRKKKKIIDLTKELL